jgi:predicted phage tail protein
MDKVWSFTTAAASSTDTTPPETTIDSGPIGSTNSASASLAFSSNELGSTFECSLDNATYSACTSPKSYASLVDGSHTFEVRAKDGAGNIDATPASRTWTVDTLAAPLAAPSNLLATRSGSPSNQRIDLTWADSSSAEAGFVIERSTTSNFTSNLVTYTVGVNATSYRDTALQSNTTYYYRVFAVDSTGKKSAPSNVASVTTK